MRCGRALWRRLRLERRVNRDPYNRGRIIDVSRAVARELDMIDDGAAMVSEDKDVRRAHRSCSIYSSCLACLEVDQRPPSVGRRLAPTAFLSASAQQP